MKKSSSGSTLIFCTYFADGSLKSLTNVSEKTVFYAYDWIGNLSEIKDEKGQTIVSYTHTQGGRLQEMTHGNGIHTRYAYDTDGNIIHLRIEKGNGETISDLRYTYDLNGNRTLKAGVCLYPNGSLAEQTISYGYDQMDRLISEVRNDEETTYLYDLCGNRLDKHGKEAYNYNQKNQLVSRSWSGGYTAYAYDLQGNLLTATGTEGLTAFSYNAFNQQISVAMPNGNRLESRYDAEYLRAGTTQNGSITSFSYYNGELLAESSPDGDTISRYILGYGVAAGWNREKEGYHPYHLDEQYSTAYITGINGEIENHYQYDAFGVVQTHQEEIHNRIFYTGQQYDQSSGQYYLRARYYNPVVGRFLQEDVYRGDGLNLYAYCANNPVVYYDPSGYALSAGDYSKIQHDTAGEGYAYHQNQHHKKGLKNRGLSSWYEGSCFQSHHMLQGEWARVNLKDYGYDYDEAPTISLGTGYYLDSKGKKKVAPHTILNNHQTTRRNARGGDYSSTLHSELVFGATDLLDAGMSEKLVFSELERNYKMLDALNEQNRAKISNGELEPIKYDKDAIEQAVREKAEQKKQEKQNQATCKDV